jgi:alkylation response protein AidB-like acyl-CoA dehydrogenase
LLQFERGNAYAPGLKNALEKTKKLARVEQSGGAPLIEDTDFRRKLAAMEMKIEALNATELRIFSALSAGEAVGAESSMLKCAGSEAQQAITELSLEAVGGYAAPFVEDTFAIARAGANSDLATPDYAAPIAPTYFNYRKASIYAGSNEIQRNIMSKMVLGL